MTDTITLPRATVQQVLEAIDLYQRNEHCEDELLIAGHFLRTALEQQQAEPVCPDCKAAVLYECVACSSNNYPPQRKPLTKEQCLVIVATAINGHASTREAILWAIEYVERHHGIKENT